MSLSKEMQDNLGISFYFLGLAFLINALPDLAFDPQSELFLFSIGYIALWRYGWGLIHFIRAVIYIKLTFPRWRQEATLNAERLDPSKLYILATFFRIKTEIAARVMHSIIQESLNVKLPVMIVLSIVEAQDEELILSILGAYELPENIVIHIVRVEGKGKRYGLAQGMRTISRDMPDDDALCLIMDGDTILMPDCLKKSMPFFKMMPEMGALTTDEISIVEGHRVMKDWYDLRFAQRHLLMSSISLSKRVMTLTGRMSVFRANIVASPDFIQHMEEDYLDHWRLGKIRFLTGDDKSSLYYLMQKGYEQIYLPDVQVITLEDPPSQNFLQASTALMMRWFGNMLRTNARILKLGTDKMPFFVWWSFLDQRLSMWTTFCGPVFACLLSLRYGPTFFLYYFAWVGIVRGVMSLELFLARPNITWRYPFLLYYNQVYAAIVKTWMLFNLDRQIWTRQKTRLKNENSLILNVWSKWSSRISYATSLLLLLSAVGLLSSTLIIPDSFINDLSGTLEFLIFNK